jgi:hypothetical protein
MFGHATFFADGPANERMEVVGETTSSPRPSPPGEEREKLRPVHSLRPALGSFDSPDDGVIGFGRADRATGKSFGA